jgi:hypothetical protein
MVVGHQSGATSTFAHKGVPHVTFKCFVEIEMSFHAPVIYGTTKSERKETERKYETA